MTTAKNDQLIRLIPRSGLGLEIAAFLLDRKARGLSPRTVEFYRGELRRLRQFLEGLRVTEVPDVTAAHLRHYLLYLAETRNPGGVHADYRAVKTYGR